MKKKMIAMLLLTTTIVSLCFGACTPTDISPEASGITFSTEIPATAEPYEPVLIIPDEDETVDDAYLTLSMNLARMNYTQNENMLISPASIEFALGMALAGAEGETLAQMNRVLGNTASREEILAFCESYQQKLGGKRNSYFNVANSIWINKDIVKSSLKKPYTTTLDDVFDAESYCKPFTDATKNKINDWCSKKTDKMIPEILNQIDCNAAVYLINALSFDAKWEEPYEEYQIKEDIFHNEDGTEKNVNFLHDTLGVYYEIDNACGFHKYYEGGEYAFLAILPDEEVGLENFLKDFDADSYRSFMESATGQYDVYTKLPKFTNDYSVNLNEQLQMLGITDAFTPGVADFSGIIDKNQNDLFIDKVIHKTHIEVDENGTKAAAITLIEMNDACTSAAYEPEYREVYLDRPFLYMIVDMETEMPVFIGTVNQF